MERLPYWLKGGIIGVFIALVFNIPYFICNPTGVGCDDSLFLYFLYTIRIIGTMPSNLLAIFGPIFGQYYYLEMFRMVFSILFWFFIGAIVGLWTGRKANIGPIKIRFVFGRILAVFSGGILLFFTILYSLGYLGSTLPKSVFLIIGPLFIFSILLLIKRKQ